MRKLSNIFLILAIICVTDTIASRKQDDGQLTVASSSFHKSNWTSFNISNLNPFKGMMHWKMPKMADISTKWWSFPVYKAVSKKH